MTSIVADGPHQRLSVGIAGWRGRIVERAARYVRYVDWPIAVPLAGLVFGLVRGWLQPALHQTLSVFDLAIVLPGTDQRPISWGVILLASTVLLAAAQFPGLRGRPTYSEVAAVLALFATVGFVLQSCLIDQLLQHRLGRDEIDLGHLQRIAGFTIPRPLVTTLGPIPMSSAESDVFSGLRSGYYVAIAAAIGLLAVVTTRRRRARDAATRQRHRTTTAAVAVISSLLVANFVEGGRAQHLLQQARVAAAIGHDASAAREFRLAISRSHGLDVVPDVSAEYGMTLIRRGAPVGPQQQLATSRLLLDAGHDLTALQTVGNASERWPTDASLSEEFVEQALRYLSLRGAPQAVHRAMPATVDSPVLRLALARYEIVTGDYPNAIADARSAISAADDSEVRSIGLTFLGLAQVRSGEPTQGRRTLRLAVAADEDYVNVMARSLLTGLYTTLPL